MFHSHMYNCIKVYNIEAPPSLYPLKKYCDITGLEVKFFASFFIMYFSLHLTIISGSFAGSLRRPKNNTALPQCRGVWTYKRFCMSCFFVSAHVPVLRFRLTSLFLFIVNRQGPGVPQSYLSLRGAGMSFFWNGSIERNKKTVSVSNCT